MNKLLKNEWKKLFAKKTVYILIVILIAFILMENILQSQEMSFDEDTSYFSYLEEELSQLDYHLERDNEYYIELKTTYEVLKLQQQYPKDSWQYSIFDHTETIYSAMRVIIENTYGLTKDEQQLILAKEALQNMQKELDEGNWKAFLEDELKKEKEQIAYYQAQLKGIESQKTIDELNEAIAIGKLNMQALEWRIQKEIVYDNSFLSQKIEEYRESAQSVYLLENKENRNSEEELEYHTAIKQMHTSQYYIENNIQIDNEFDARFILMNINDEYGVFILLFSCVISGTIIATEFQKGTIKLLLTKPFKRSKILLSKYIVSIMCIFLFLFVMVVTQYIVGGFTSGFDAYAIPAIDYDYNTNCVVVMPVWQYSLLIIAAKLPMYILLTTLAFTLSVLTTNSAISIALPFLGSTIAESINYLIDRVKILKYFVTANWDLGVYLFGGKGIADGLNLWISCILCMLYLAIMLVIAFVIFNKRDIKNV